MAADFDAIVIGAGHNGLVGANMLAERGWSVLVLEAEDTPGGAVKSGEITEPGFTSDLFSSFYPLAAVSPAMRALELERYGLRWRRSPLAVAHPQRDGRCAGIATEVDETAALLERFAPGDGARPARLAAALVDRLRAHGGQLECGRRIERVLVGERHLPRDFVDDLAAFQYDNATIKVDWSLEAPVPWIAEEARRAGTIHVPHRVKSDAGGELEPRRRLDQLGHRPSPPTGRVSAGAGARQGRNSDRRPLSIGLLRAPWWRRPRGRRRQRGPCGGGGPASRAAEAPALGASSGP